MRQASFLALFLLSVVAIPVPVKGEETFVADQRYIKEHYTKYEYMIPMRDGVKLFTAVYVPKDDSTKYPILLNRTPYGVRPYGASNYPSAPRGQMKAFAKEKFIFANQDVRGRYASEGEFIHVRPHRPIKGPKDIDESTDAYDTIDWLVKHAPNNNGNVGMLGISYPGFYSAAGMIDAHPALKCVSPQAPIGDWFIGDDFRHNGALYLAHSFRFFSLFGQPLKKPIRQQITPFDYGTPNGYEFYLNLGPLNEIQKKYFEKDILFLNDLLDHGTYDSFWKERRIINHMKDIKPAVMTVGGWFDAEDLYGPLQIYKAVEQHSPKAYNVLVIGPWSHGGWHGSDGEKLGNVHFDQKSAVYYRNQVELAFLNHFLKGGPDPKLPEALVFETGTNQWKRYDSWPPANVKAKALYFHPKGSLRFDSPAEKEGAFDEYVSDPAKPVPFIPNIAVDMVIEHMVDDQRFATSRPDVLVYVTDPLSEDLTIAGPISPKLFVSTSGTDSDWVVKLIDVYSGDYPNPEPNPTGVQMGGYQQLVRGEPMRGKFRESFESPKPFEPNKVTKVEFTMPDAYHTFRRGHRIMIHLQSSWFPLVDRNPQQFMDIYHAKESDFKKATQRVYRSEEQPSHVVLKVLSH